MKKKYWTYTDLPPEDYSGAVPNDEWAICEFKVVRPAGHLEKETARVTKIVAIGSNKWVSEGFEMYIWDPKSVTSDTHKIIKFLFERRFE